MAGFYLMATSVSNELIESYKEINFVYNETDSKAANKLMAHLFLSLFKSFQTALCEKCPNTEFSLVCFFHIRSKYGKILTRKNSLLGHFSRSTIFMITLLFLDHTDFCQCSLMQQQNCFIFLLAVTLVKL